MSRATMLKKRTAPKPCEKCGDNRWRTVKKGKVWLCRNCGNVRK